MINEQDKQAILDGAYGITKAGYKAKIVHKSLEETEHPYLVLVNTPYGESSYWVDKNLCGAFTERNITGLWVKPLEPFNLEKALAGEPVRLRCDDKAYILFNLKDKGKESIYPLIGYIEDGDVLSSCYWAIDGKYIDNENLSKDIIGMWEEPENNTIIVTLPRALSEPRDEMWFIGISGVIQSCYNKSISKTDWEKSIYFGSKEDAQAWRDAMRNSYR